MRAIFNIPHALKSARPGCPQLGSDAVDITEHPKLRDALAIRVEKCSAGPSDLATGRRHTKKLSLVSPFEGHPRSGPIFGCDEIIDHADIVAQGCMH